MVTGYIQPNGDASPNEWSETPPQGAGDQYLNIDEDEGSPNQTDYIYGQQSAGHDNKISNFDFETISGVAEVTQVTIWTYGQRIGDNTPEVDLNIGGWQGYVECVIPTTWDWTSNTFTGLSGSQADLNGLQVRYRADVPDKLNSNQVSCVYCEIIYTISAYAAGKPMGIDPANVGNVCGVDIANIGKIKGV